MNYHDIAESYREQLVDVRRALHRHPELSFEEFETADFVRAVFEQRGIPMLEGISGNSTVGILKGSLPGPTILVRADCDALPIQEQTGLPFASEVPGVMHACGHDAHTSVLLALADYLSRHREEIRGTIKLASQQGEEKLPGGALQLIEDGVMKDVNYCLAWHCAPELPYGVVSCTEGYRAAGNFNFKVTVNGKGGHAGFPFRAIDSVSTAALITDAIGQILPWTVDSMHAACLSVTYLHAGEDGIFNVVPQSAELGGNCRYFHEEDHDLIIRRVRQAAEGIALGKGCTANFELFEGHKSLYNNPEGTGRLRARLQREGIDARVTPAITGSDDFASIAHVWDSTYFNVGTSSPDVPGSENPPHSPKFCIHEGAMVIALETMLTALDELQQGI